MNDFVLFIVIWPLKALATDLQQKKEKNQKKNEKDQRKVLISLMIKALSQLFNFVNRLMCLKDALGLAF